MRRHYEETTDGAAVEVLIPETQADLDEIERRSRLGEVDGRASFGDCRGEREKEYRCVI